MTEETVLTLCIFLLLVKIKNYSVVECEQSKWNALLCQRDRKQVGKI